LNTRALIVDDEALCRMNLKALCAQCAGVEVVAEADTVAKAAAAVRKYSPDVVFLDIDLRGGQSGFDLPAQLAGTPPRIVFVTSHREHALEAFGLNALHYLVKPVALGMLKEALARLPAQNDPQDAPVLLKEASRQCVVKLRDVLAVRSSGDYTDVYLGAANVWCVHKTLKQWRDELPAGAFVALGRFLIVNRNEIQGLSKDATGEGATLQIGNSLHLELSKSAAKAAAAILRERANP
jgi:two-component system, LytTR family, response regulator